MNVKKYSILIVGGSICLALFVVGVALLIKFSTRYNRVMAGIEQAEQKLDRLNNRNPFPSDENIGIEQENYEIMKAELARISGRLAAFDFDLPQLESAQLSERYLNKKRELRAVALKNNVRLDPSVAFGFDRYAAGALPDKAHVERLTLQLEMIDQVCLKLFQYGIDEFTGIQRQTFDGQSAQNTAEEFADDFRSRRSRRSPTRRSTDGGDAEDAQAAFVDDQNLLGAERFTITFKAKEGVLWSILNDFAKCPMLINVYAVEVSNTKRAEDYTRPVEEKKPVGEGVVTGLAPETDLQVPSVPFREERVVAGRESLDVKIDLDVFYLLPHEKDKEKSS